LKLEEMKRITDCASPGPWRSEAWQEDRHYSDQEEADEAFIAMARSAMPKLIAVAEEAKYLPPGCITPLLETALEELEK
jgi:hypothetical protein